MHIITGTLSHDGTVRLDQQPNVSPGPVEVMIRALNASEPSDWWSRLQQILADQERQGFVGTVSEIDRDDTQYEERMREIDTHTIHKNDDA